MFPGFADRELKAEHLFSDSNLWDLDTMVQYRCSAIHQSRVSPTSSALANASNLKRTLVPRLQDLSPLPSSPISLSLSLSLFAKCASARGMNTRLDCLHRIAWNFFGRFRARVTREFRRLTIPTTPCRRVQQPNPPSVRNPIRC